MYTHTVWSLLTQCVGNWWKLFKGWLKRSESTELLAHPSDAWLLQVTKTSKLFHSSAIVALATVMCYTSNAAATSLPSHYKVYIICAGHTKLQHVKYLKYWFPYRKLMWSPLDPDLSELVLLRLVDSCGYIIFKKVGLHVRFWFHGTSHYINIHIPNALTAAVECILGSEAPSCNFGVAGRDRNGTCDGWQVVVVSANMQRWGQYELWSIHSYMIYFLSYCWHRYLNEYVCLFFLVLVFQLTFVLL